MINTSSRKLNRKEVFILIVYTPGICILSKEIQPNTATTVFLSDKINKDWVVNLDDTTTIIQTEHESLFLSLIRKVSSSSSSSNKVNIIFDDINYATPFIPLHLIEAANLKNGNSNTVEITRLSQISNTFPQSKQHSALESTHLLSNSSKDTVATSREGAIKLLVKIMKNRLCYFHSYIKNDVLPVVFKVVELSTCKLLDVLNGRRLKIFHSFVTSNHQLKTDIQQSRKNNNNKKNNILKGGLILPASIGMHKIANDECVTLFDFSGVYPRIGSIVLQKICPALADTFKNLVQYREQLSKKSNISGSFAVKLLSNSIYGCLGSRMSDYSNIAFANLITKNCRDSLENMVKEITGMNIGAVTLYGHTDSVLVKHKTCHLANIISTIEEKVCKTLSLKIKVEMTFEKSVMIIDRVSFAGLCRNSNDGTLSIVTKGLVNGKATPKIVRTIFREYCIKPILLSDAAVNRQVVKDISTECRKKLRHALSPNENPSIDELVFFSQDQKYKSVVKEHGAWIVAVEKNRFCLPCDLSDSTFVDLLFYERKKLNPLLDKIEKWISSCSSRKRKGMEDDDYFKDICINGVEAFMHKMKE